MQSLFIQHYHHVLGKHFANTKDCLALLSILSIAVNSAFTGSIGMNNMFSLVIQSIQRVLFRHSTMEFNQKSSGQIEFRLSAIKQCVIYQAIEIKVSLENDNLIAIINRSKISMAIISHNNCSFERENKQAAQMQFWAIRLFRLMLLYFYYILHPTHSLEKDSTKKIVFNLYIKQLHKITQSASFLVHTASE